LANPCVQDRLEQGAAQAQIISELLPQSRDSALSWARRPAAWEEYRPTHPAQAIALGRLISLRAMREYGLTLLEDGRIVDQLKAGKPWTTPKPALTFHLDIAGEKVRVEYTPEYFPSGATIQSLSSKTNSLRPPDSTVAVSFDVSGRA
jgi:hypothetical protein